jgi:hypothetical protein
MSWPGGRSGHKRLPPAGFKKGLPRYTPSAHRFARRRGEEERADTLFRPRATTNKAAARRETAASGSEQSNIARAARPRKSCGQKHQSVGWSEVVFTRCRVLMWLRGNNFLKPCAAGD